MATAVIDTSFFPVFWFLATCDSWLPPLAPWGADGTGKVQHHFEHFVCPTGGLNPLPYRLPRSSLLPVENPGGWEPNTVFLSDRIPCF